MVTVPRQAMRDLYRLVRRAVPAREVRNHPPWAWAAGGPAGLHLRCQAGQLLLDRACGGAAPKTPVPLPLQLLADAGAAKGDAALVPGRDRLTARWDDRGVPALRDYPAGAGAPPELPPWPGWDAANPAGLLEALARASAVACDD